VSAGADRKCGHRWRERLLSPVTTIHLFVLQVLDCNTACAHLPRLSGMAFSDSAYCQARARLSLIANYCALMRHRATGRERVRNPSCGCKVMARMVFQAISAWADVPLPKLDVGVSKSLART
jgi:hypothetical protein